MSAPSDTVVGPYKEKLLLVCTEGSVSGSKEDYCACFLVIQQQGRQGYLVFFFFLCFVMQSLAVLFVLLRVSVEPGESSV